MHDLARPVTTCHFAAVKRVRRWRRSLLHKYQARGYKVNNVVRVSRAYHVTSAVKAALLARGNIREAEAALEAREDYAGAETLRLLEKTVVAPIDTGAFAPAQGSTADFIDALRPATILPRIGAQEVPFEFRYPVASSGATAYWVGEGVPVPIAKQAIAANPLAPTKLCVLVVVSGEVLRLAGPAADAAFQRSLIASVAEATDESFIDPGLAATSGRPASITHGAPTVAGTSDPVADIENLAEVATGVNWSTSKFVCNPLTALRLSLHRDAGGNFPFPNAGVNGGDLCGVPLLTSTAVPLTSAGSGPLILIDGSGVQFADGGMGIATSGQSAIAMSDSPSSPSQMVSMFQTNSSALLVVRFINWQRVRVGSVAYISNPNW